MARAKVQVRITSRSINSTVRRANRWGLATQVRTQRVIEKWAFIIEAEAVRDCPVDTGALQATIRSELRNMVAYVKAGNEIVDYALFVELGTVNMDAQPYLYPAFNRHKEDILRDIKKAVVYV